MPSFQVFIPHLSFHCSRVNKAGRWQFQSLTGQATIFLVTFQREATGHVAPNAAKFKYINFHNYNESCGEYSPAYHAPG